MTLHTDLIAFLLAQSPAISGGRFYAHSLPQEPNRTLPAGVVEMISSNRERTIDGFVGRVRRRWRIHFFAPTLAETRAAADATVAALEDYRGLMGATTIGSVSAEADIDLYEDDTRLYHTILDFLIAHSA